MTALVLPIALPALGALLATVLGRLDQDRRLPARVVGWGLAAFPAASLLLLLTWLPTVLAGPPIVLRVDWMPSLGVEFGLLLDGLSLLFTLLVSGIGALILIYSGYYLEKDPEIWRFWALLMAFTSAMLGLLLAYDSLVLFLFWEATTVISFLLIGHKKEKAEARRSALIALLVTGLGGVALLIGLLLINQVTGSSLLPLSSASGDLLRQSQLYPLILALIALAAFTKSAQFPFHFWLPSGMIAPTPASAFLHSATMVKAGIYLLARLNIGLGFTEAWFWLLSLTGLFTMLLGAYLGTKQQDLKALLAYSTISQLGALVALIGQDTSIAFKALVVGISAHALYKSALFLLTGIIDHETGTRSLEKLGGLRQIMPLTFLVTVVAGLSMAGLPPLFGFLAKETLLATATHPSVPALINWVFPALTVLAGALILLQAGRLLLETFLGNGHVRWSGVHDPALGMLLAPALPALASLALGLLPEPPVVARMLAAAGTAAFGAEVKVSLALWTGLSVPLALSVVAVTFGAGLIYRRKSFLAWQQRLEIGQISNQLLEYFQVGLAWLAQLSSRFQHGKLRRYLVTMLGATLLLIVLIAGIPPLPAADFGLPPLAARGEIEWLRLFTAVVAIGSALATVLFRRDLASILAMSLLGLTTAVIMLLEPAPDVALVQIVVDFLATVILVLVLTRIPRAKRRQASRLNYRQSRVGLIRDLLVAGGSALVVAFIAFSALASRPRPSLVTPFFEANAKVLAGAKDVVGAILVDFRAFDTLIEITVFGLAGLGALSLLQLAAQRSSQDDGFKNHDGGFEDTPSSTGWGSPLLQALARIALPLTLMLAFGQLIFGHDRPGDGFTAGVIFSLAVGFNYIIFGFDEVRGRLGWLHRTPLVAIGLALALTSAVLGIFINGIFFSPVNLGELLGLTLPPGLLLGSALLFEIGIFLAVLGGSTLILDSLGHPEDTSELPQAAAEQITISPLPDQPGGGT